MRLHSFRIENYPPIGKFEVTDLADLVVLAGRNGVGKSKITEALIQLFSRNTPIAWGSLRVQPTSEQERNAWQGRTLDTTNPQDCALLHGSIAKTVFVRIGQEAC